ncbi:MAG: GEVED domain-containing protein [Armatimonadota bacterium]
MRTHLIGVALGGAWLALAHLPAVPPVAAQEAGLAASAEALEWSDAHDYPTASHRSQQREWLGPSWSKEREPRSRDTYDDGIQFDVTRVHAGDAFDLTATIHVALDPTGAATRAETLRVWIDWDHNERFDPDEMVVDHTETLPTGTTVERTFRIRPPEDAKAGDTWVRARLGWAEEDGELGPNGPREWGEVEDYEIDVVPVLWPLGGAGALAFIDDDEPFNPEEEPIPELPPAALLAVGLVALALTRRRL